MGFQQTVDGYTLGKTGPHQAGSVTIEPKRGCCWLKEEDIRWKRTRDPQWTLRKWAWTLNGPVYAISIRRSVDSGELQKPPHSLQLLLPVCIGLFTLCWHHSHHLNEATF